MFLTQDAAQEAEAFLVSQITYIEPQVYRIQYPEIRYPRIVPVDTSAPEWIPSVTYFSVDGVGKAAWFNGRANDVPFAETIRNKFETPVHMAAIGYQYDLEELNQARMLGRDLNVEKAYYARLAAEQFLDAAALFGDATKGLSGLCNNASASATTAAATGTGSATTWASKTASNILADINAAITGISTGSTGVEMADTVLLPIAQFSLLTTTMLNTTNSETIMEFVRRNNYYTAKTGQPLTIEPVWGLETAGSGATARMVVYWRNPTVVKMHVPMPFQFIGGVWRDGPMLWKVPGAFRFGGVDVKRPASFAYVDGI